MLFIVLQEGPNVSEDKVTFTFQCPCFVVILCYLSLWLILLQRVLFWVKGATQVKNNLNGHVLNETAL